MMDLEFAIQHCIEVAEQNEKTCNAKPDVNLSQYRECAEEHRQLAQWLKELKRHREAWQKVKEELWELVEWHDCPIEYDGGNDAWYRTAIEMAVVIIDKALGEVGESS